MAGVAGRRGVSLEPCKDTIDPSELPAVPTRRTVPEPPASIHHRDSSVTSNNSPAASNDSSTRPSADGRRLLPPSRGVAVHGASLVETLIATVLLGVSPTVAPAVVALVTFAVYSVDHVADADTDAASTPNRALVARHTGTN